MTKKIISALGYLKTISLTVLAIFILVIVLMFGIQYQVTNEENQKASQEEAIDYYLVGLLIDKNQYLEGQNPDDYRINLKLGNLYHIKKDSKNAENEYHKAIAKAPFNEFYPHYKLALLLISEDKLEEAETLINSIEEKPSRRLISYKGDVFKKIADSYYDKGEYEEAADRYRESIYYYEIIKSKKVKDIKNSLASTYVYLAEQRVNELQIAEAIELLEKAKVIIDAPIIKYKLALLLKHDDPTRASQYFEEVFKEEPGIINYDEYYNFLAGLVYQADATGQFALAELYKNKIKKIDDYYQSNILYFDDLQITSEKSKIKLNKWKRKYNIMLDLRVKNVSGYAIKSLYLYVIFKDKNGIIDSYTNEVANDKYYLRKDSQGPLLNIKISKKQTQQDESPKEVVASIYAAKQVDGDKLHIKDIVIKENAKQPRRKVKLFFLEFYLPEFLS